MSSDARRHIINQLLMDTYSALLGMEQMALEGSRLENLTINEIHILESVGEGESMMGEIAARQRISMATMTSAIDKLVDKGYCTRRRGQTDRRCVLVRLTRTGCQAVRLHRLFHIRMVEASVAGLTTDEENIMMRALTQLNEFIEKNAMPRVRIVRGARA